jgi:hypothetical protein
MNMQHTSSLRLYKRYTRIISDERCAEILEEIEILVISTSSEQPPTSPKLARKEKRKNRRNGRANKKVKFRNFKQNMKRFWRKYKCRDFLEKIILIVIQSILGRLK